MQKMRLQNKNSRSLL